MGPVAFNSEGVSAGKDQLNMAHVCKVDSTLGAIGKFFLMWMRFVARIILLFFLVPPGRFERPTPALGERCSIP